MNHTETIKPDGYSGVGRRRRAKVLNECRARGWREGNGNTAEVGEKTLNAEQEGGGSRRKDDEGRADGAAESQGVNKKINISVVGWVAHLGSSRRGRQHK